MIQERWEQYQGAGYYRPDHICHQYYKGIFPVIEGYKK